MNKIFDLFWQEKATAHMGAGFGLAISKGIVEEHGGKIWAESTPGLANAILFHLTAGHGIEDRVDSGC